MCRPELVASHQCRCWDSHSPETRHTTLYEAANTAAFAVPGILACAVALGRMKVEPCELVVGAGLEGLCKLELLLVVVVACKPVEEVVCKLAEVLAEVVEHKLAGEVVLCRQVGKVLVQLVGLGRLLQLQLIHRP